MPYVKFIPEEEYVHYFQEAGKQIPPVIVFTPFEIRGGVPGYLFYCSPDDPKAELVESSER